MFSCVGLSAASAALHHAAAATVSGVPDGSSCEWATRGAYLGPPMCFWHHHSVFLQHYLSARARRCEAQRKGTDVAIATMLKLEEAGGARTRTLGQPLH